MSGYRYWCFDDADLDKALQALVQSAAAGGHPEAQATAESYAEMVRSFLHSDQARQFKLLQEVKLAGTGRG